MTRTRALLLLAFFIAALSVGIWAVRRPPTGLSDQSRSISSYHGRPISFWLAKLENWQGDTNDEAFLAFRTIGTNAIHELLAVIQSGGPKWQKTILDLNQKQSVVQLPYGTPWKQETAATWALYAIGPEARPVLPVMRGYLLSTQHITTASVVLAGIGSEAVPSLFEALTNRNWAIRHAAASGLAWERADLDQVVPALIATLGDTNSLVRVSAANSLGALGAEPAIVVPALTNAYSVNDTQFRSGILVALGQFETNARPALPLVLNALKDPNADIRQFAEFALKQIDPDAAVNVGVK